MRGTLAHLGYGNGSFEHQEVTMMAITTGFHHWSCIVHSQSTAESAARETSHLFQRYESDHPNGFCRRRARWSHCSFPSIPLTFFICIWLSVTCFQSFHHFLCPSLGLWGERWVFCTLMWRIQSLPACRAVKKIWILNGSYKLCWNYKCTDTTK